MEILTPSIIMKRGCLLLLFLAIAFSQLAYGELGTSIGTGLVIVDTIAPVINLTSPLNNSGNINENITFLYNVSDGSNIDNCSLIINNKINITDNSITKNAPINFRLNSTSLGAYNWSINCTDSLGFNGSSETQAFFVNFLRNFNGSTTNTSLLDLRNITNFVLEITTFGKINFSDSVSISQDKISYIP